MVQMMASSDPVDRIKKAVPDWEDYYLGELTPRQLRSMDLKMLRSVANEIHESLNGMSISASRAGSSVMKLKEIAKNIHDLELEARHEKKMNDEA